MFGVRLRQLRESRSLTQEELAERSGITVKAIGALERGERLRPYPHTVRSLADGLGLDEAEWSALVAAVPPRGGVAPEPVLPESGPVAVPPATPLIGREDDVAAVAGLLADGHRLVTVTGPGGVGKTRLALEVVARHGSTLGDRVVAVDLASLRDPALVLPAVAGALGAPEGGGTSALALAGYLAGRRLLVLLDNLEQLLEAGPALGELVAMCPDLRLLVTSRARLRVRGEHEVPLGPLASGAAVQMFLDRAAATGAALDAKEDGETVAAICRRLDGLPLALELAAARTGLLTPAALLSRLDDGGAGPRDLPARQRSMAATLDWSHDLLDERQQELFAELAVFSGDFSLEGVEAVSPGHDDVLDDLAVLVEQSLVTRVGPRFRYLEPVRQYAAVRLQSSGMAGEVADRLAEHARVVAKVARDELHGPGLGDVLDGVERDHALLRSGFLRLVETGRGKEAGVLVRDVWLYLALRGHAREGLDWLTNLDPGDAHAATATAALLFVGGDIARMAAAATDALDAARTLGEPSIVAEAGILAGHAAVFGGDTARARTLLDEALRVAEEAGDDWAVVHALLGHGQLALVLGDLDEAGRRLRWAEDLARRLGSAFSLASVLNRLATVTGLRGDDRTTAALLAESTRLSVETRIGWTLGYALPALAGVAVNLGRPETAARLFGASASLTAAHAVDPRFPVSSALSHRDLAAARELLGDAAFRLAWEAGREAGSEEIGALADELSVLARG